LANTTGAYRAETVTATKNNALFYNVEYKYDSQGRVIQARVDGVGSSSVYVEFEYEANAIVINDYGTFYRLELSSADNSGNVCNVMDLADAHYTSKYVFNPDLYYINIYGTPVKKLPQGHEFELSEGRLSRIGKYYYEH
jgi:hypothetical protein